MLRTQKKPRVSAFKGGFCFLFHHSCLPCMSRVGENQILYKKDRELIGNFE